jgi:uncharacterized protein (TIGR02145 family)
VLCSILTPNILIYSCDDGLLNDEENSSPTCFITSPENDSEFLLGEKITITVSAEDEDNNLRDVSFYANDIGLAVRDNFPSTYEWDTDYEKLGAYTITVKVRDQEQEEATDEINITFKNIVSTETVTDIDGNVYSTAILGDQIWMAENLKTTKYKDGTPIDLAVDTSSWFYSNTGAYCWYDNNEEEYADKYGALYNWYAVKTGDLCPDGWHVPTDDEWKTLEIFLGMRQGDVDNNGWRGTNEGSKLAGNSSLWSTGELIQNIDFDISNFKAIAGGTRKFDASFAGLGSNSFFWTASQRNDTQAWYRNLNSSNTKINRSGSGYDLNDIGCSVRCIKD